jgi:NAD(P)-dependent dehydrogenase (short-subunit alcohol dehydrogenase family)
VLPNEYDIEGKTVIVTGAARGIGKGIAGVLAESGARVMVTALTERYLGPLAEEMARAGHPIETVTADATKAEDWRRTVDLALERWGHIDVLINNLGDAIRKAVVPLPGSAQAEPHTDEEWRSIIDINLTEAFMGCRAVGSHMIERRRGKVINISGFAARRSNPEMLAYAAAKAGLVSLTKTMALEWAAYGVTVNCIAPGIFPDPETGDPTLISASRERAKTSVPLGRVSGASDYMTGETIYLDGGVSIA